MLINQKKIEDILVNNLLINSNNDTFYNCYYKCANKNRITSLHTQKNNEIIFGRRGTGKTTLFKALAFYINQNLYNGAAQKCIYVDMENIVPNSDELIGKDNHEIVIETYRKLLEFIAEELTTFWVTISSTNTYYGLTYSDSEIEEISKKLDRLYSNITCGKPVKKFVSASETMEGTKLTEQSSFTDVGTNFEFSKSNVLASFFAKLSRNKLGKSTKLTKITKNDQIEYVFDISKISESIISVVDSLKIERLFLCIDEFTRVDKGLDTTIQPYIAQLIKDTFFRHDKISVKLSSLWNKTEIQMRQLGAQRIGIELGEDIKRGFDLDTMFLNNDDSVMFFKKMIANTYSLAENQEHMMEDEFNKNFQEYIIDTLFSNKETFKLMICGSHGIPRVFCNLLTSAISQRRKDNKKKITPDMVFHCIVCNYTQDVRRKTPYSKEIIKIFDDYISQYKQRFIIVPIEDYEFKQKEIDGMLDINYMHQYPSEKTDRKIRNQYKVFLVHYGNYLESLGIKEWRKKSKTDITIYPDLPEEIISHPETYELKLK